MIKNMTNEKMRTHPDRIIYDPTNGCVQDWGDTNFMWLNEHVLVSPTLEGKGCLLATWTSQHMSPHDKDYAWLQRIAYSHSDDGGRTWTDVAYVDGAGVNDGLNAAWQIPVMGKNGRFYIFYTYGNAGWHARRMRCCISDDYGRTWGTPVDMPEIPKTGIDNPDMEKGPVWICCSGIHYDPNGNILMPYTHWADNDNVPAGSGSIKDLYSQIEVMRIENLDTNPEVADIEITFLNQEAPVTVPHPFTEDASIAQEPYLVNLPDGRIFMAIRTNLGEMWYTVSEDNGVSWRKAEPLRYQDDGEILKHPSAPCPVFSMKNGDFLLLFNNNDGFVFGAKHVWDMPNRRPAYLCRGEFRPTAHQPIWWSKPKLFIDNDNIPWGPDGKERNEAAAYCSFSEMNGEKILWYPDRKGFLLGKDISAELLNDMEVTHEI